MSDTAIEALRYSEFPNSSDCISRQAAIDALRKEMPGGCSGKAEYIIEQLPTAQPELSQIARDIATIIENEQDMRVILAQPQRMRGRWINEQLIPDDITGHVCGECSICGKLRIVDNFCPNCGSYNGGEEDGQI